MLRKIFLTNIFLLMIFIISNSTYAATAPPINEYYFSCKRLVNYKGNAEIFDHKIYYFSEGENKCLVFICHGSVDSNGNYCAWLFGKPRHDYAQAIAETIAYWTKNGYLNCGAYNYIFMSSCHQGYAPKQTRMPVFDIDIAMASRCKGLTYHSEEFDANGNVIKLALWRDNDSSADLNKQSTNVSNTSKGENLRYATDDEKAKLIVN